MNLDEIRTEHVLPLMRDSLARYAPNHGKLDYAALFASCHKRGLRLWNVHIAREVDIKEQRAFERALANVGMRAGLSIPWAFSSGYAFGVACHGAAGGDARHREEAAVICGLYMFLMGLFDHLLDEYPHEIADLGEIINADCLGQCVLERNYQALKCDSEHILANGILKLYQVYFRLCHRLLDRQPDATLIQTWLDALRKLHSAETESVDRRISRSAPSKALIEHAQVPSVSAFWGLAVSACLGEGEEAARRVEKFARDHGRLTWFADDASDIEKDIKADIWSGLALRIALDAENRNDIENVILGVSGEAGRIVADLYANVGDMYWDSRDSFSVADVLWAYIWAWVGGLSRPSPLPRENTPSPSLEIRYPA